MEIYFKNIIVHVQIEFEQGVRVRDLVGASRARVVK